MYFDSRLWKLTEGVRLRICWTVVLGLSAAAAGIARLAMLGWLLAIIFDSGFNITALFIPILVTLILIFVRGGLQFFKEQTAHVTASKVQTNVRKLLHERLFTLGPAYFNKQRSGDTILTLVEGVEQLETFFGQYLPQLIIAFITPIGLFFFMIFLDLQIALIFLIASIATLFVPSVFHKWNKSSSEKRRNSYGNFGSDFLDTLQGLNTLKAFGQSTQKGKLLAKRAHEVFKTTMWVLASNSATGGLSIAGIALGSAAAISVGILRVNSGELSLAVLLITIMLGVEVFRPIREMIMLFHQGLLGISSAIGVFKILDTKPLVKDIKTEKHDISTLKSNIKLNNISFKYPETTNQILSNVNIEIKEGERLAIVGTSGAGKTTIVRLLLKIYDLNAGNISIDNINIKELSFKQIRSLISLVSQDNYLFNGTVKENVKFGNEHASDEMIINACIAANAHEFIENLPRGYNSTIGERGIKLSGGQRQRLAIARSLIKNSPILILDEALSQVDANNEAVILDALDKLIAGKTTLIIAHRLSSVLKADRIAVMDSGSIKEIGTHDELLKQNGIYSKLIKNQLVKDASRQTITTENKTVSTTDEIREEKNNTNDNIIQAEGMNWLTTILELFKLTSPWKFKLSLVFILGLLKFGTLFGLGITSSLAIIGVKNETTVLPYIIWMLILAPLSAITNWLESWVAHDLAFRLLSEMRIDLYKKLDKLSPAFMTTKRTGDIVTTATQDVEQIEYFFAHTIANAFVAILIPLAVLIALLFFNPILFITILPILIFASLTPFILRKNIDSVASKFREIQGWMNAHVVDTIQGILEIISFQQEKQRNRQFINNSKIAGNTRVKHFSEMTKHKIIIELLMGCAGLLVVSVGSFLVGQETLNPLLLPLATILVMSTFLPISEIAQTSRNLADTLGATRRIYSIHQEPVVIKDGQKNITLIKNKNTSNILEFKNTSFNYPNNFFAINKLNLSIEQGSTVAIVGPSGAGKTTLAHLILRFWDPQSGSISFFGNDLRDFKLDDLRQSMALVSQDVYLFNTTIKENIHIARVNSTHSEISKAIEDARLNNFVQSLPEGLNTIVGERGTQLSGGQRQRVALARAFLKNSPLLILDEATSHLDTVTENEIKETLDKLSQNRTTIIIAHRLSTIVNANKIAVMETGNVVQYGEHKDLMKETGIYKSLIAKQILNTNNKK